MIQRTIADNAYFSLDRRLQRTRRAGPRPDVGSEAPGYFARPASSSGKPAITLVLPSAETGCAPR